MTNEEAIDIIKSECYVFNPLNFDRSIVVNTALDMAIKALSAEPCENVIPPTVKPVSDKETIKLLVAEWKKLVRSDDADSRLLVAYQIAVSELKKAPCEDVISRDDALDACDQSINIFDATDRIKELPSVKPKVKECEDCISRKWLKNAIHNFYKGLIHTPTEEDIQAYIDVAPSVTPQPKIGRWIMDSYSNVCECSECAYVIDKSRRRAYCPMCGAKMESEEV